MEEKQKPESSYLKEKFPGTGSLTSIACMLPQTGQLAGERGRQERTPHSPGATSKQQAVEHTGCRAVQEVWGARSRSAVPHSHRALQTDGGYRRVMAFTGTRPLEIGHGKACGSRAPGEHSKCRAAQLLQEQEGMWSKALQQLLMCHGDGDCENWEEMQGTRCSAI